MQNGEPQHVGVFVEASYKIVRLSHFFKMRLVGGYVDNLVKISE
jgi:hypothetical protein